MVLLDLLSVWPPSYCGLLILLGHYENYNIKTLNKINKKINADEKVQCFNRNIFKVRKRLIPVITHMTFFLLFSPLNGVLREPDWEFWNFSIYSVWGLCTFLHFSLINFSVCKFWLKILNEVLSGIWCQHVCVWQSKHAPTLVRSSLRSNNLLLRGSASSRVGVHMQKASWKGLLIAVSFYYMLRCHVC